MRFMKASTRLLAVLAVFAGTPVLAERAPHSMGADGRVQHVNYSPTDVIRIDTHLRVNTAIELGQGERISQVLLGDSESFEVEVLSNRHTVSIKPVVAGAASNMTIYTNRRAISFVLTEGRSRTQTFRVVVEYPDERRAPSVVASGVRDVGYQFAGDAAFRPVRVWNNGRQTFFEMPSDVRPSVFGINGQGFETTLNSTTQGRVIKVAGVQTEFAVRIGEEVICIRRIAGGATNDQAVLQSLISGEF